MRKQNSYRVINEDIAGLRYIVWAMMDDKTVDSDTRHFACLIYVIAGLLLSSRNRHEVASVIKELLISY